MEAEPIYPLTGEETFDNTALASVVTLTPPRYAQRAKISIEAANVRFWESGTEPSSTSGHLMYAGGQYELGPSLDNIKLTRVTSHADLKVQVSYFGTVTDSPGD